ncbi:MAG: AMP-binding protein [Alistipes sp.]|nr:AMP-binding protein [Alistipes sp.]MBQ3249317.1 AMP-binding protein [Alistipes sp.]
MTFTTIYEVVKHSVEKFSERIAFSMIGGEDVSYKEVGERVEKVQDMLLDAGVGAGDKVAILSSSMPNWGVSYFAVTSAGMIAVPILPDFTSEELDLIIAHSEAKAILVSDKLYTKLSKETVERFNIVIRTKGLNVISQRVTERAEKRIPEPDDIAAIIYTSGTTSKPKGVMLTHYNIAMQLSIIPPLFDYNEEDVLLSILPLSHTYECTLGMIYPFSRGAHIHYMDRPPTASALMPALAQVRPTVIASVPLIMEKVYAGKVRPTFQKNALLRTLYGWNWSRKLLHKVAGKQLKKLFGGRMRLFAIGGAKFDAEAERFLLEAGFPYGIGYGLTETAPLIAGAVGKMVRVGSTGPSLPDVQIRLDDVNPDTGQGEIVVKTPCCMRGYYKNEEATRAVFTEDGWFRTGDLGAITEDGWIYIKGRLKNMIVGPSGENIYPEDIEEVLNSNRFVAESVVTEEDGKLIALVYFDTTALEEAYDEFKFKVSSSKEQVALKMEEIKKEVMEYVNSKVNRFSKITKVVDNEGEFEKTPTKKIRRFVYDRRNKGSKPEEDKK